MEHREYWGPTFQRTFGWTCASAILLLALSGCSGDDGDDGSGGQPGGSGGAAAGTGGSVASGGAAGSGGTSGAGTGGTSSGGTGGTGGTGGSEPASNCGDLTCESGEVCISSDPLFVGESSNDCAPPPDGCAAYAICDCGISDWEGSPIYGCAAFVPPTLYVYDLSCGDAPCADGTVCLIDETDTNPPTCVDAPDGCTTDDTFCDADCGEQVATAAGMDHVSCQATSVGAAVTVAPPG